MQKSIEVVMYKYFQPEVEMVPDQTFEALIRGESVEAARVRGANQIDLGSAVAILACAIEVSRFAYDIAKDRIKNNNIEEAITKKIQKDYSALSETLSASEMKSFVSDVAKLARE